MIFALVGRALAVVTLLCYITGIHGWAANDLVTGEHVYSSTGILNTPSLCARLLVNDWAGLVGDTCYTRGRHEWVHARLFGADMTVGIMLVKRTGDRDTCAILWQVAFVCRFTADDIGQQNRQASG